MIKNLECFVENQKIYVEAHIPDTSKENYPTVIISHGFSLDHTTMKPYAEKLLKHDIASIIYDFRGGGLESKSDGQMSDMSLLTEVADLNAIIDLALKCDFVDNSQLYLAGHSQGGLVTSLVAVDRIDDIQSLFLFAPGYSIPDNISKFVKALEMGYIDSKPDIMGDDYIDSVIDLDVYDKISGFTKNVYIFHGKRDDVVALKYSEDALEVYENPELIVYDDEHRFSDSTKDSVVEKIADVVLSKK